MIPSARQGERQIRHRASCRRKVNGGAAKLISGVTETEMKRYMASASALIATGLLIRLRCQRSPLSSVTRYWRSDALPGVTMRSDRRTGQLLIYLINQGDGLTPAALAPRHTDTPATVPPPAAH